MVVLCLMSVACYDPHVDCPASSCAEIVGDSPTDATVEASPANGDASAGDAAPPSDARPPPPPPPIDAPPPPPIDAPPQKPCAPGCSGTCDDGVCVIDCVGTEACHEEIVCPLTGPCRVTCNGRKACKQGVRCGLGRCTVTCQGDDACAKRVRCEASCACDVTCGPGGCKDEAWCPHPWCEAGDGCTSAPNSCSSCS